MRKFIVSPHLKNTEPVYTFTRSNPKSRLKWIWFPVLKVGSTAIRGMNNRHLRPEWFENDKNDEYNPVSYVETLLRDDRLQFKSTKPKHENLRLDEWTDNNPVCSTPNAFPGDDVNGFFKFAFVRNPWDRLLSCWCDKRYVNKHTSKEAKGEQTPFKDYVKSYRGENMYLHTNRHAQMQCAAFLNVEMDFVGRLENAHEDFSAICDRLDVDPPEEILHKNITDHKHYTEYYDDETRKIVEDMYRDDIEMFNYKYGE